MDSKFKLVEAGMRKRQQEADEVANGCMDVFSWKSVMDKNDKW